MPTVGVNLPPLQKQTLDLFPPNTPATVFTVISMSGSLVLCATLLICLISVTTAQNLVEEGLSVLTPEDFDNARMINKNEILRDTTKTLEEVNGNKPDIRSPGMNPIPSSSLDSVHRRVRRNGVSRPAKLWPQGRIPYAISSHYTTHERALLARAVKQYHDKTCVRFVPRASGEADYLFIGKVDGCFSEVGRTSGIQVLSLDNGCMEYSTIIHEIMHVVGFYHEHERWDRDNYIDIIWQNIDRGALDQFGKVDLSKTSYYGQPYDYKSILHYDSLAFSKNGLPTMLPKENGFATTIGNAKDFSDVDLAKINRMYKCEQRQQLFPNYYSRSNNNFGSAKAHVSPIYSPASYYKGGIANSAGGYNFNSRPPIPTGHSYFDNENASEKKPKPSSCEDRITVCWWTQDRCLSPNIYLMMRSLCPKTCKFC